MATSNPVTEPSTTASGSNQQGTFTPSDRVVRIPDNILIGIIGYLIYVSCF
tara:strand:- start:287 stop:439 length:153 start_codon:yes stop_codon:yes gene_type:complete